MKSRSAALLVCVGGNFHHGLSAIAGDGASLRASGPRKRGRSERSSENT